jgi:hypothetical protein
MGRCTESQSLVVTRVNVVRSMSITRTSSRQPRMVTATRRPSGDSRGAE